MSGHSALQHTRDAALPIRPNQARTTRKIVKPRTKCHSQIPSETADVAPRNAPPDTPSRPVCSNIFHEKLTKARQAQEAWLGTISTEVAALKLQQDNARRRTRRAREEIEEHQRQQDQRIRNLQQVAYEAKVAEAEERRRLEIFHAEVEQARLALQIQERRERNERLRREAEEEERRRFEEKAVEVERRRIEAERIRLEAEEAERERIAAEAAEAERARREAEEAERIQQERERECAACMDRHDMDFMIETPCSHWYCPEDLLNAFENAFAGRRVFQCCGQEVPIANLQEHLLTPDFVSQYNLLVLELATPNRTYCSNRSCGLFIPPTQYRGPDLALCSMCGQNTCRHCKGMSHDGSDCPEDEATQQALNLGDTRGWRRCRWCRNLVEKIYGCDHITCPCGQHFCYVCGEQWRTCVHSRGY